jgi:hypothetical protein
MRFWWGKPDGKRPHVRRRRTWDDNIRTDFQEIVYIVEWIDLAQDRGQVIACCECGNELPGSIRCGKYLD